jgi:hypothetical protein
VKRICKTSPNHEKNKFEIHGHWRSGASKRNS